MDFSVTFRASQVLHGSFNKNKQDAWDLSVVHGHPRRDHRRQLLDQLRQIKARGVN